PISGTGNTPGAAARGTATSAAASTIETVMTPSSQPSNIRANSRRAELLFCPGFASLTASPGGSKDGSVADFIPSVPEARVHDKRAHTRIPLSADVACEVSGGATIMGRARDISIGGMFIESETSVSFGTQVSIVLRLPGAKTDL